MRFGSIAPGAPREELNVFVMMGRRAEQWRQLVECGFHRIVAFKPRRSFELRYEGIESAVGVQR